MHHSSHFLCQVAPRMPTGRSAMPRRGEPARDPAAPVGLVDHFERVPGAADPALVGLNACSGLRDTPTRMARDKLHVAKRAADVYNRRDIDTFFAECATADVEWWPALQRAYGGDCYRGREGVETFLADTWENWEELQWVAEEYRDLGDCVLAGG